MTGVLSSAQPLTFVNVPLWTGVPLPPLKVEIAA
jgi:hypothetical protein